MRAICASLVVTFSFAGMATAQEAMLDMPAPSLAETDQAQPDWFQQFTFNTGDTGTSLVEVDTPKSLKLAWVKGDRWNISVDMTSRDINSPLPREEMSAGASFLITPRISVGGEVRIGAEELDSVGADQDTQVEAGIRLRSAFKF
ncbi:MAG: NtrZ family periplasmic regulatory protein [Pseudomonadota bacterium]